MVKASMAARLGRGGGGGGAQKMKGDARLKILNSGRGKTVDARQMLTKKAIRCKTQASENSQFKGRCTGSKNCWRSDNYKKD